MDNAAAVQVGFALLLIALVIASTLLVLGIIATGIGRIRTVTAQLDRLAIVVATEQTTLAGRFADTRELLAQASQRLADVERRLHTQELE